MLFGVWYRKRFLHRLYLNRRALRCCLGNSFGFPMDSVQSGIDDFTRESTSLTRFSLKLNINFHIGSNFDFSLRFCYQTSFHFINSIFCFIFSSTFAHRQGYAALYKSAILWRGKIVTISVVAMVFVRRFSKRIRPLLYCYILRSYSSLKFQQSSVFTVKVPLKDNVTRYVHAPVSYIKDSERWRLFSIIC